MLILKILLDQKIYIDDGAIVVQLVNVQGNSAKLGFTAPPERKIVRANLCPDGPARCCRCGGKLPPTGSVVNPLYAHTGCPGLADPDSGRCRAFIAQVLCGDGQARPEAEGGVA